MDREWELRYDDGAIANSNNGSGSLKGKKRFLFRRNNCKYFFHSLCLYLFLCNALLLYSFILWCFLFFTLPHCCKSKAEWTIIYDKVGKSALSFLYSCIIFEEVVIYFFTVGFFIPKAKHFIYLFQEKKL
jgi:hypothetical protein